MTSTNKKILGVAAIAVVAFFLYKKSTEKKEIILADKPTEELISEELKEQVKTYEPKPLIPTSIVKGFDTSTNSTVSRSRVRLTLIKKSAHNNDL